MTKRLRQLLIFPILRAVPALVICTALTVFSSPAPAQFGGAPAGGTPSIPPPSLSGGSAQVTLNGSVATGGLSATPLSITLDDAVQRGLKYNLAALQSEQNVRSVGAQRRRNLSALLPSVSGSVSANEQQSNLAAFGFNFPGLNPIIGPFHYVDARASLSQSVFNYAALKNLRSADASVRAAQLSAQDDRNLIMQAVSNAFLSINADAAQVKAVQSQLDTAQALLDRATHQKEAGTAPGIDVLRADVELQTQKQRLVAQKNALAKSKLELARVIGLPNGQQFEVVDPPYFQEIESMSADQALSRAYSARPDYKSAEAQVQAAELARRGAVAEYYPSVALSANYGAIGIDFSNSHGTFGVTGTVQFNILDSGRIRADVEQADVNLQNRRNDLGDLKGRIDYEVRTALLDLESAHDEIAVARRNRELAGQTLDQGRDRFAAGVTDNLEVVQAQQSVSLADDALISAAYRFNIAKISLARALGLGPEGIKSYFGGK